MSKEALLAMVEKEVYLGDGAFVSYNGFHIVLFTSNGINRTNEIFLEPNVLHQFEEYIKKYKSALLGENY